MSRLISLLDSATPFVQAFDVLLMLFCGVYCLRSYRRSRASGVRLLAIACFFAAVVLLGFFLSSAIGDKPLLPLNAQVRAFAYVAARLLAPFELLLFAFAIILVARRDRQG